MSAFNISLKPLLFHKSGLFPGLCVSGSWRSFGFLLRLRVLPGCIGLSCFAFPLALVGALSLHHAFPCIGLLLLGSFLHMAGPA